ncbi:peptidylglycine alpha-hydroxylating monooxygenase-like isoform X3 [Pollicipes pollicipes]|uniref:peptidylglycine alpha-hydroxylating monooxygenase-like isoform X3 n=1 Tax=Pollicipes pollicipes TaxID=41117 RepID=UPI00188596F0|nr:peptidylglycine alpha-hydroxylating monooxygenase-like isoform X3 [Pollicipes pollicipes]
MAAVRTGSLLLLLPWLGLALETGQFSLLMPQVVPPKPETYFCTSVRLLDDKDQYIVGFEPNATQNTAHHMLLYGCERPGTDDAVWSCGDMAVNDPSKKSGPICRGASQVIYAWAKNAPKLILPKGVAFHVGKSTGLKYLTLQVHYADVSPFKDGKTKDDSGVFLTYTETPQPKAAGVLLLGTGGFIFPNTVDYMETACDVEEDKVIHPFAFRTHTHALGEVVSGWKVQPKDGGYQWTLIGKMNPQLPQMFYPVLDDITLTKGDIVAARCTMNNYRSRITRVGATADDEMCNFYMMYWTELRPLKKGVCFTLGPPYYYWHKNGRRQFTNVPTLASASEMTAGEMRHYLGLP